MTGLAFSPVASHATVSGSMSGFANSDTTLKDLTNEGSSDWTHWGNGGVPGLDFKASGGRQLSGYTTISAATVTAYTGDPHPMTWSDGSPTASEASISTGVRLSGLNNGFVVTAPADTTQRIYWIYCGGTDSGGTLTAHLSDGSAPDYVEAFPGPPGAWVRGYTIFYNAASAGQTLTITWKQNTAAGSVTLSSATLAGPPPPPANLAAVSGVGKVTLTWTGTSQATSYNVKRGTVTGGPYTTIGTAVDNSFTDTGLSNGTTYYYVVSDVGASDESANSNEAAATPYASLLPVPTGLTVQSGDTQLLLHWNASAGATSYNVKRSTVSGGPYATIGSQTVTGFTDSGLTNYSIYYYVVSAVDGSGETANSLQVGGVPLPQPPQPPTGLTAQPGNSQVTLNWTASFGATDYNVKRGTVNSGPYTKVAQTSSTHFFDTGLTNGTRYYYVVTALNAHGEGGNSAQASVVPSSSINPIIDFNGDAKGDLILQSPAANKAAVWYMNGGTVTAGAYFTPNLPANWTVVAEADFNHDGHTDLVLVNPVIHKIAVWYMNGTALLSGAYVSVSLPAGWTVVAALDVDGDGNPDLVLENSNTHQVAGWQMNGTTVVQGSYLPTALPTGWNLVAVADFNGDGSIDLVLQNRTTNKVAIWYLDIDSGAVLSGAYPSTQPPANWFVAGVGDFNYDGKPDLVLQNSVTGQAAIWTMNNAAVTGGIFVSLKLPAGWSLAGNIPR